MPRRRKIKLPPRIALPALVLESKIMAMLRGLRECAKLKGIRFVHVGSFGQDPNWFAQPLPSQISDACRRAFDCLCQGAKRVRPPLWAQGRNFTAGRGEHCAEPITKAARSRISAEQGRRLRLPPSRPASLHPSARTI